MTMLIQNEVVRMNSGCLEGLYAELGAPGAEEVVCRALEELATRLTHTARSHEEGRLADMRKSARSMIAIADQIGMQLLSRVAADVTIAADNNDLTAIAATVARLLRIGETSFKEVAQMQDLSI